MSILSAIGSLCLEDADAALLLAQQSSLIPGIIVLLHRHSAKILGVDYGSHASIEYVTCSYDPRLTDEIIGSYA